MDFWLRNPDYLAELVLDWSEETADPTFREQAGSIFTSKEPEARRYQMLRYRFGAYEPPGEALSVLASAGLVFRCREGTPGHTRQHNYYLTATGRSVAHDMIAEVPELTYDVDRVKLLVELTGGIGPSALTDMQCEQPEYAGAEWHSRIQTIDPRVRERLAVIDGERGLMTTSAPGGTPAQRVAARRGIAVSHVEEAMATPGVAAVATPAAPRSMRVRRLRITGTKDESGGEGAFDRNFASRPGS